MQPWLWWLLRALKKECVCAQEREKKGFAEVGDVCNEKENVDFFCVSRFCVRLRRGVI